VLGTGKVCITMKDTYAAYFNGCYLTHDKDADRVRVGDCISIAIPGAGNDRDL